jgi:hypothetical protein
MASDKSRAYSTMSTISAIAAAQVARRGLGASWKAATGRKPPANPADPDVDFREALAWALTTGAIVAVARMVAMRRAASYYTRSTGHLPPQLEKDGN